MEKEFLTYEQALAFKKLGFDEPCLALFNNSTKPVIAGNTPVFNSKTENESIITAPLKQQAFRWFREKYGLEGLVYKMNDNPNFFWFIIQEYTPKGPRPKKYIADCVDAVHKTYEEAESACLNKFIEIYMDFYKLIR